MEADGERGSHGRRGVVGKLGLIACLLMLAACTVRCNGFTLVEWWRDLHSGVVISHGPTSEKVVALTFDDGPDPNYTPRVLDILHRYGIHATFFQEGKMIQQFPRITRRVVEEGNCVGNHTYTHPYLARLSPQAVRKEMQSCDQCLALNAGITTTLFRSPRGDWNPTVYRQALQDHERLILWSVALEHHEVPTPKAMAQRVLRLVRPGDIVLMHDGAFVSRESTVQALPLVIEGLRKRGYRCVTVPELLHLPPANTRIAR